MSKRKEGDMGVEAQRELQAIDGALRDETVADEHATLAELAVAVWALRPRPREEFVRTLDVRATRGFKRDRHHRAPAGRSSLRGWSAARKRREAGSLRAVLLRPAPALLLIAILAAAVVVPLSLSGGGHVRGAAPASTPQPGSPATRAQAQASAAAGSATRRRHRPVGVRRVSCGRTAGGTNRHARARRRAGVDRVHGSAGLHSRKRLPRLRAPVERQHSGHRTGRSDVRPAPAELKPQRRDRRALALGHVRSENDTTNDVTDQANSLQRSLGDAQAERTSLLTQLAHTSDPRRAAALKAQLRTVERTSPGCRARCAR